MADHEAKRGNGFAYAMKNGTGAVLSRLAVVALPFIFAAAIWLGQMAISLLADKVTDGFNALNKRLDGIEAAGKTVQEFDGRIQLKVQRNSDDIEYLKEISVGRPKDRRP